MGGGGGGGEWEDANTTIHQLYCTAQYKFSIDFSIVSNFVLDY